MRIVLLTLGALSLIAGVIGIFLPIVPTVPFIILAAFLFGKSSKRAHKWLLSHPKLGPAILNWQTKGVISRRSKCLSAVSMIAIVAMSILLGVSIYIVIIQLVILSSVSIFIWTRPEN